MSYQSWILVLIVLLFWVGLGVLTVALLNLAKVVCCSMRARSEPPEPVRAHGAQQPSSLAIVRNTGALDGVRMMDREIDGAEPVVLSAARVRRVADL